MTLLIYLYVFPIPYSNVSLDIQDSHMEYNLGISSSYCGY